VSLRFVLTMFCAGLLAVPALALAAAESPVLLMHNKQFEPKQLEVPGGIKVKLVVRNMDAIPAEFESYDLSREVVVPGHGEVDIYIGPLEPGSYEFFNDFNRDMQGLIVVKPANGD